MEGQLILFAIVAILAILALRWLMSWWIRIPELLGELRKQNELLQRQINLQRATLDYMAWRDKEMRSAGEQPPPPPVP